MVEELNTYLNKLVNSGVFPGCNYGIIVNDEIFFGSVGYKSLIPKKAKNDVDNLYDIASLSKLLVTNVLITFLLRDEKIKLDDYVYKYIPDFKYDDVKIIHLLTHSSGINPAFNKFNLKDKEEFINNTKKVFEAGSNVYYTDINFILLGFIIEKIYQKPLDVLAQDLIFKPLGMNDTSYNPKDKKRCVPMELTSDRGLVCGFVHDEKAYFLNGVAGNAGVFSTVKDLSHFAQMILDDGYYNHQPFLDLSLIDMWFKPLFINEDGLRRTPGWIYGKSSPLCRDYCSDDTIIHTGFPGHHLLIDRGNNLAIIFLSNSIHPSRMNEKLVISREKINKKIYDLLRKYDKI